MSWLFGIKKEPTGFNPEQFANQPGAPSATPGNEQQQQQGQQGGRVSEAYRFDSSALERAAKAAKELEQSSINRFKQFQEILSYCLFHL